MIIYYVGYDSQTNTEWQIMNFDADALNHDERLGALFYAVHDNGDRELVSAAQIKAPTTAATHRTTLVSPKYVDDRITAVADAFEALEDAIKPSQASGIGALLSGAKLPASTLAADDGAGDSMAAFRAAISRLRELAKVHADDEHTDN